MQIDKINLVNDYLKEQLWMDFELCNMNCEAVELNKKYKVTNGNQIFKICDTNIKNDMYIIAKDIEVQIIN